MNGQVLAIAVLAALATGCLVRGLLRFPARLGPRIAPYTERARGRLGTALPVRATGARSAWGPMVTALSERLALALGSGSTAELEQRLRQAGLGAMSAASYRRRQLLYTAVGVTVGVGFVSLVRFDSGLLSMFVVVLATFPFAIRLRAKVDALIDDRRIQMRAEAHTVCQMLAVWLRTGDTPSGALDRLTRRTTGIVPAELAEAAAQIRSGAPPEEVLDRSAAQTAEPAAARLYRLYGATWNAGGDPSALLALSDSLRTSRRDATARRMARRRIAMTFPLVAVIAPILILFIAAALPNIVLGR